MHTSHRGRIKWLDCNSTGIEVCNHHVGVLFLLGQPQWFVASRGYEKLKPSICVGANRRYWLKRCQQRVWITGAQKCMPELNDWSEVKPAPVTVQAINEHCVPEREIYCCLISWTMSFFTQRCRRQICHTMHHDTPQLKTSILVGIPSLRRSPTFSHWPCNWHYNFGKLIAVGPTTSPWGRIAFDTLVDLTEFFQEVKL